MRRVAISALLAELASGCYAQCPDAGAEDVRDIVFAAVRVGLVVGSTGELDAADCIELCETEPFGAVTDCTVLDYPTEDGAAGEASGSGGDTTAGDPDIGGALGDAKLRCTFDSGSYCKGRAHAGSRSCGDVPSADDVARDLARSAHDEALSVQSFLVLARELAAHSAPADLVARARNAAADEVRHAHMMAALAEARGVRPATPHSVDVPTRPLLDIAIENAIEGCVYETWFALEAALQAKAASDGAIQEAMRRIATDEARHAQLAWDIDAWMRTQLEASERAAVDGARNGAARTLARRLATQPASPAELGKPDRASSLRLVAALDRALWTAAAA